ncbi:MAG: hypothetical protein NT130_05505 [Candidatus Micrarchaeota archaeon]|nr:hypothetical protein [Candidatus Micrarchaeota archaeon]
MGRQANYHGELKWSHLGVLVKLQNQAIIQLLSDGKPRMPVEICRELKGFPKATLYIAMRELVMKKILVPKIIEDKGKKRKTLTDILGYTLGSDIHELVNILDEADGLAGNISMR